MPEIFDAAKRAGALCAYLSGGGSTIAAFAIENEERIARAMTQEAVARGFPGRAQITAPSAERRCDHCVGLVAARILRTTVIS